MNFVLANSDNRQKILASIKEDVTENAKNTPHKTKFNTTSLLQRISISISLNRWCNNQNYVN